MYDYATRLPKKVYDYLKNFIGDDVIDDYVNVPPIAALNPATAQLHQHLFVNH